MVSAMKNSLIKQKVMEWMWSWKHGSEKQAGFCLFITELKMALQPHRIKVSVDVTRENRRYLLVWEPRP